MKNLFVKWSLMRHLSGLDSAHKYCSLFIILFVLISRYCYAGEGVKVKVELSSDAKLFLDLKDLGRKSFFEFILPIGEHSFKILYSTDNSWDKSLIDTTVMINSDTTLYFTSPKYIPIISKPSDAKIYFNSQYIGLTPKYLLLDNYLRSEDDTISLSKEGYLTSFVSRGDITKNNISIFLDRDESGRNNFINKNIKYFLFGSAGVFGGLSAYFKQVANSYFYDNGQSSANSGLVKKYDNLSAVFSVLLQINFGLLVYFLLSE